MERAGKNRLRGTIRVKQHDATRSRVSLVWFAFFFVEQQGRLIKMPCLTFFK